MKNVYKFVKSITDSEDDSGNYEYVDLGLPSGLKWATCNIGASSPEDYGNYYAWGETEPKSTYYRDNSITYRVEMEDISGNPQYDAATANWGSTWRMPTGEEYRELRKECTWEWTTENGVYGMKVTGPNGNYIFLPAAGYRHGSSLNNAGEYGRCWSSSPNSRDDYAYGLYFGSGYYLVNNYDRYYGRSVRPVLGKGIVAPTVTTNEITEIKAHSAACGGNVTDDGGADVISGVCWSTSSNPTIKDNHTTDGSGEGEFTSNVTGLMPNTTYYLRAYATNKGGTGYGEEYSFTTENSDYVDLGLPSGLKWATCNIGASSPEDYGNYYAWGETEPKSTYTEDNSITYRVEMEDISGNPQYDAATANWGSTWRMPTREECEELVEECTWEWTTENGVYGMKVTGPNGCYIFLPAAGRCNGSSRYRADWDGDYCSSTPGSYDDSAYGLLFDSGCYRVYNYHRCLGRSVRPVLGKGIVAPTVTTNEITEIKAHSAACGGNVTDDGGADVISGVCWSTSSNPTIKDNHTTDGDGMGEFTSHIYGLEPNTTYYVRAYATNAVGTGYGDEKSFTTGEFVNHEYVDLGLPSGLKWATCNIGASSPEDYGNYYAWGETEPKSTYYRDNSITYRVEMEDISGNPQYDAATANWGSTWRMPTGEEYRELRKECTWEWTTENGVYGMKVTGPNGNYIFLPAAGYRYGSSLFNAGGLGYYWSSSPYSDDDNAYSLYFRSGNYSVNDRNRYGGRSVRPVKSEFDVPTIATIAVTEITPTMAKCGGNVTSDGGAEVTARGVCWSTSQNPTIEDAHTTDGSGEGEFTSNVTGLMPNTTYYLRAYATNEGGTGYGGEYSFITDQGQPGDHEYVDLGLPSGLKWATCNIGASSPEDYGNYYAWGEIKPKSTYTEDNSITYRVEMEDISGNPQYDAATANWGSTWRMPTNEECQELVDECDWFFVSYSRDSRVSGYKVTGPNGNSIFLPAAGLRNGSSLYGAGERGYYWSSTPGSYDDSAYNLRFDSGCYRVYDYHRYLGRSVRPVLGKIVAPTVTTNEITEIKAHSAACGGNVTDDGGAEVTARGVCWSTISNPTIANNHTVDGSGEGEFTSNVTGLMPNTTYYLRAYATNKGGTGYGGEYSFITEQGQPGDHEYIDLGLPSGLKWATCNIGASSPEDYGNYYAWGETEPKSTYYRDNSITYRVEMEDISGNPQYDAATANWGSTWRMPTEEEYGELRKECTWEWTTENGVYGMKVTGPNGNYIFLPAAGRRDGSSLNYDGYYWSSTPDSNDYNAYYLGFNSCYYNVYYYDRYYGRSVRPVSE